MRIEFQSKNLFENHASPSNELLRLDQKKQQENFIKSVQSPQLPSDLQQKAHALIAASNEKNSFSFINNPSQEKCSLLSHLNRAVQSIWSWCLEPTSSNATPQIEIKKNAKYLQKKTSFQSNTKRFLKSATGVLTFSTLGKIIVDSGMPDMLRQITHPNSWQLIDINLWNENFDVSKFNPLMTGACFLASPYFPSPIDKLVGSLCLIPHVNANFLVGDSRLFQAQINSNAVLATSSENLTVREEISFINAARALSVSLFPSSLMNNLIAYYPFNGNANDESGNGNDGTVYSAVLSTDRFGNPSSSYNFNGVSSYIEMPGTSFNFGNQFSISIWTKPATTQGSVIAIMDKSHGTNGGSSWVIESVSSGSYYFQKWFSSTVYNNIGSFQLLANNWCHLVVTKQGTSFSIYVNNNLILQNTIASSTILGNQNLPLIIGAENGASTIPASSIQRFFAGYIDDILIYNRTLSASEIKLLYNLEAPTSQPSNQPTRQPSSQPRSQPTTQPSKQPQARPSTQPTGQPIIRPTNQPSNQPTRQPTTQPTDQPTKQPINRPSGQPTGQPSRQPHVTPSTQPTSQPSDQPIARPTSRPSKQPINRPSGQPTGQPSQQPHVNPSTQPINQPSGQPTGQPSQQPHVNPSTQPTNQPGGQPIARPTSRPSKQPINQPSGQPTGLPSQQPHVNPSAQPTNQPSGQPIARPTSRPSKQPINRPSGQPTGRPSQQPHVTPSAQPTNQPSGQPIAGPTSRPSKQPINQPSSQPTGRPSQQPNVKPSTQPTSQPSGQPIAGPTSRPSKQPISQPSGQPTGRPSEQPNVKPSTQPTGQPNRHPTSQPTDQPSSQPTGIPTLRPSVSQSPTQAVARNWTALLGPGSFINHIAIIYKKTVACGDFFASCFQFDNVNGKLSGVYRLPWDAIATVIPTNNDLVIQGLFKKNHTSGLARFIMGDRQMTMAWGLEFTQKVTLNVGNINPAGNLLNTAGYDEFNQTISAVFDVNLGKFLSGYTRQIPLSKVSVSAICSNEKFLNFYKAGTYVDSNLNEQMFISLEQPNGYINQLNTFTVQNSAVAHQQMQVNAMKSDVTSYDVYQGGGITLSNNGSMNAYIARISVVLKRAIAWALEFTEGTSQIRDMVLLDSRLFAIGDAKGFSPERDQSCLIIIKIQAATGSILKTARLSIPGDLSCYSATPYDDGIKIACNVNHSQPLVVFADEETLSFGQLPDGYKKYHDVQTVLKNSSLSFKINSISPSSITQTPLNLVINEGDKINISSSSFVQIYPENMPSYRPTEFPTLIPTPIITQGPSPYPTFKPTNNPTSEPSIAPTASPTISNAPSESPSSSRPTLSFAPSENPTVISTEKPTTKAPSEQPSMVPSKGPTLAPTQKQETTRASRVPTLKSTEIPTQATVSPTASPVQAANTTEKSSLIGVCTLFGAIFIGMLMWAQRKLILEKLAQSKWHNKNAISDARMKTLTAITKIFLANEEQMTNDLITTKAVDDETDSSDEESKSSYSENGMMIFPRARSNVSLESAISDQMSDYLNGLDIESSGGSAMSSYLNNLGGETSHS